MGEKKKLYVDAHLRVVNSRSKAKAIVNELYANVLQIMFLNPIVSETDIQGSMEVCRTWVKNKYPRFYNNGRVVLPTPEICLLANKNISPAEVVSCHTSLKVEDHQNHQRYWVFINDRGIKDYGWGAEKRKNVYPTICVYKNVFKRINKDINFSEYEFITPKK